MGLDHRLAWLAVALLAGGLWALAGDTPKQPDERPIRVGTFNANRVYNQCALVREFNRKVDEWNRQLREAGEGGDDETRRTIRAAYTADRDRLKPRFDKGLQRALAELCAEKGIAVAFDDSARVAYLAKGVQTVQLGDELIRRIGSEDPNTPNAKTPDASTPDAHAADANAPSRPRRPSDANAPSTPPTSSSRGSGDERP